MRSTFETRMVCGGVLYILTYGSLLSRVQGRFRVMV